MLGLIREVKYGGGLCGDGGGLFIVGHHKLLYNSPLVGYGVSHIKHLIIHFSEDVGVDTCEWPEHIGRHRGSVCAAELVSVYTGLNLTF